MRSLRARLVVAWVLSLAAALAVGGVLVQLYRLSSAAQSGLSAAVLEQGCAAIAETYSYYTAGWAGPRQARELDGLRRDLEGVVGMALARAAVGRGGLEAGIWQAEVAGAAPAGALVGEPASDLRAALMAAAADVLRDDEPAWFEGAGGRSALACPLGGPVAGLVAWVAQRSGPAPGWWELRIGVGVLLALVLVSAAWLSVLLLAWRRGLGRIEAGLAGQGALPLTGERELDRMVVALNEAGTRATALAARVAAGERLAALGRVAAGVAHEIRNPVAAMRLRAENALAGDPARRGAALQAILEQLARLDRLSGELLAMTQRRTPAPAAVQVDAVLRDCAAEQPREVAVVAEPLRAMLDAALLRRVLDNLLENARQHTPPDGTITLSAQRDGAVLRITVADTGPGVDPALRPWLFEPFVTGRPDGTGLGLAIARELAEAMGGRLTLADSERGAHFVLELPMVEG